MHPDEGDDRSARTTPHPQRCQPDRGRAPLERVRHAYTVERGGVVTEVSHGDRLPARGLKHVVALKHKRSGHRFVPLRLPRECLIVNGNPTPLRSSSCSRRSPGRSDRPRLFGVKACGVISLQVFCPDAVSTSRPRAPGQGPRFMRTTSR